eukprot:m.286056 g.286056  ORF g.286056 m.286056 type:complete len:284 (-) comp19920_c0_seq9:2763-3614(-)
MVFYMIGLGLGTEHDITVKGLEIVKRCSKVLLEAYTAILMVDHTKLSEFYGVEVTIADRELIEQGADSFLNKAKDDDVALLVVGDPFGATTHTDLFTRCREQGIPVEVVHNASIMNAVGCCGLQLYNFGRTVSIVFFKDNWRPTSFYPKIMHNTVPKLHTLLLLDIKVKEQTDENLIRGRKIYEPPRYMTINQCIAQLLEVEEEMKGGACTPDALAVGVARVGHKSQQVVYGTLAELQTVDFGAPLHSLVLVGETDLVEQEMLDAYKITDATPRLSTADTDAN